MEEEARRWRGDGSTVASSSHLRRQAAGAADGRSRQSHLAAGWAPPIATWVADVEDGDGALNVARLHEYLCEEHRYPGSVRSVQRYIKRHFAAPKRRARRRVETPPGAQAQADWAEFPQVMIAGEIRPMHAFHLQLSHSRFEAVVWAEREDELSWLTVHNGGLRRLGGVPAVIRIDNPKTAHPRRRGLGRDSSHLPPLCAHGALPHRCVPGAGAGIQGEGGAAARRAHFRCLAPHAPGQFGTSD